MEPNVIYKPDRRSHAAFAGWHDYYRIYLNSFARYGVLSKHMLCMLTGHTPSTVRTALHGMAKAGYVQFHRSGGQVMYYLTPVGLSLSDYAMYARSPQTAFGLIQHDMAVNALMTNTIERSRPPEYGIVRWLGPLEAKEELSQMYGFERTDRSKQLNYIPDAYFEYFMQLENRKSALYPVVLEVDLGTETIPRVVKKLESGILALTQQTNGHRCTLLWIFIDNPNRCRSVMGIAQSTIKELHNSIPGTRFPQILAKSIPGHHLFQLPLPTKACSVGTGEETTWAGYPVETRELTEFIGVSRVHDRIKNELQLRTQIPVLLEKRSE